MTKIKKINNKTINEAVELLQKGKLIGFPTETWEEIRATINFAEEINVDYAKIFIALPIL